MSRSAMRICLLALAVSAPISAATSLAATNSQCAKLLSKHESMYEPILVRFLDIKDPLESCEYAADNYENFEEYEKKFKKLCKNAKGLNAWSVEDDINTFFEVASIICGF